MAFATMLAEGRNNKEQNEEAIFGMTWALDLGYRMIILELDSKLVGKWINKKVAPKWKFIIQLGRLQNLLNQTSNLKCRHVFREEIGLLMHCTNTTIKQLTLKYISATNNYLGKQGHTTNWIYWKCQVLGGRKSRKLKNLYDLYYLLNLAINLIIIASLYRLG